MCRSCACGDVASPGGLRPCSGLLLPRGARARCSLRQERSYQGGRRVRHRSRWGAQGMACTSSLCHVRLAAALASSGCDAWSGLEVGRACGARCGYAPPSRRGTVCRSARRSASYSVVRLTPTVRQIAALLAPACKAVRMAASFSSRIAWGRPPRLPRRLAVARPALMRSCVKARSYWAKALNPLNSNAPWGVVVSLCSVNERKATPLARAGSWQSRGDGAASGQAGRASRRSGSR